jgi:hypothetical protein
VKVICSAPAETEALQDTCPSHREGNW